MRTYYRRSLTYGLEVDSNRTGFVIMKKKHSSRSQGDVCNAPLEDFCVQLIHYKHSKTDVWCFLLLFFFLLTRESSLLSRWRKHSLNDVMTKLSMTRFPARIARKAIASSSGPRKRSNQNRCDELLKTIFCACVQHFFALWRSKVLEFKNRENVKLAINKFCKAQLVKASPSRFFLERLVTFFRCCA